MVHFNAHKKKMRRRKTAVGERAKLIANGGPTQPWRFERLYRVRVLVSDADAV